jgi:hypothetical protein
MSEYTPYDDEIVRLDNEYTDLDLGADRIAREVVDLGGGEEYFAEDRDQVYCKHGRYIGYPGGADFICPYCEDGADILAHALRYNIELRWGTSPDWVTVIQCWGETQLRESLGSLRLFMGSALGGVVECRVVTLRYAFWTNIPQEVEVPEPFFFFNGTQEEEVIY